ncbi:protein of unknown function (plasmid) [Cupriavidus taiwanensis]|uniref:Uncharacterized protein n=1 Tax=Cupriavidus taiwanensis TaxID=164546 RepID=A0A9Q7XT09_9BURK|nr:protein of unknown function [Cupriavidus taiwanensis]
MSPMLANAADRNPHRIRTMNNNKGQVPQAGERAARLAPSAHCLGLSHGVDLSHTSMWGLVGGMRR